MTTRHSILTQSVARPWFLRPCTLLPTILCLLFSTCVPAENKAYYLANESVLVVSGSQKVLFDPLFNNGYGQYELVPKDIKHKLMTGQPPFDGVNVVLVSHHHGDHFAPEEMLRFLRQQKAVHLFGPAQAIGAMREVATKRDMAVFSRVTSIDMTEDDAPRRFLHAGITIDASRIPHSGWPTNMTDVQNMAFRVTLGELTILHIGDADTKDRHYEKHADYWAKRPVDVAFPPYWYFISKNGQKVLKDRIQPTQAIGIHVPLSVPDDPTARQPELRHVDLFTRPGETRIFKPKPDSGH